VERQRARLSRRHRAAMDAHIASCREGGKLDAALQAAWKWVGLDPLDDGGQHYLIQLLAESGSRTEALSQYERYYGAASSAPPPPRRRPAFRRPPPRQPTQGRRQGPGGRRPPGPPSPRRPFPPQPHWTGTRRKGSCGGGWRPSSPPLSSSSGPSVTGAWPRSSWPGSPT
jgi:hypothetical protein